MYQVEEWWIQREEAENIWYWTGYIRRGSEKGLQYFILPKQNLNSIDPKTSYEEKIGRNSRIQITTYLYLTSSIKKKNNQLKKIWR
jgi:hypothetical protein